METRQLLILIGRFVAIVSITELSLKSSRFSGIERFHFLRFRTLKPIRWGASAIIVVIIISTCCAVEGTRLLWKSVLNRSIELITWRSYVRGGHSKALPEPSPPPPPFPFLRAHSWRAIINRKRSDCLRSDHQSTKISVTISEFILMVTCTRLHCLLLFERFMMNRLSQI